MGERTKPGPLLRKLLSERKSAGNLLKAALVIALHEFPNLDLNLYVKKAETMAEDARRRLEERGAPEGAERLRELSRFLFAELGFRGNAENYYDPLNSYLNAVIDRRLGIPITLSIIYMEVASRLGIGVEGIGFPGHFLVKCIGPDGEHYVDPFNGGRLLRGESDFQRILDQVYGGEVKFSLDFLAPSTPREIVLRVLNNLKQIYLGGRDFRRALDVVEMKLAVEPRSAEEVRDRALIHYGLHDYEEALKGLERYLEMAPAAADRHQVEEFKARLVRLREELRMYV